MNTPELHFRTYTTLPCMPSLISAASSINGRWSFSTTRDKGSAVATLTFKTWIAYPEQTSGVASATTSGCHEAAQ
jgi:hypothetical protein